MNKLNYFARRREASNCTILTVSPPIYANGVKKPEKNSGIERDFFYQFFSGFFSPIAQIGGRTVRIVQLLANFKVFECESNGTLFQ